MLKDIETKSDIEFLINQFYSKIKTDELLYPFFKDLDWDHHLPIMIGFWEFILFSKPGSYTGNVMSPHMELHKNMPMKPEHFTQWLKIFFEIMDENFMGVKAEDAKNAAKNIGATMKYKILGSTRLDSSELKITKID